MDPDLFMVIGVVLGVLGIPSLLSAFSESRPPRASAILFLIAGVLIVVALQNKAGGYEIAKLPDLFVKVIGRYIN